MTQPICKTHWQEIVIFITVINTRNLKSKPCYQICLLLLLLLLFFILFFDPGTQFPGNEKKLRYAMQYRKVQKSSWNERYSSSSFTKQSCTKMALYR